MLRRSAGWFEDTEEGHFMVQEGFLEKVMPVLSSEGQVEVNQKHVSEIYSHPCITATSLR